MRYGITTLVLGHGNVVAISGERFQAVVQAKANFLAVLQLEEKFDLLLENYAELEQELLQLDLRFLVFGIQDWQGFYKNYGLKLTRPGKKLLV